MGVCMTRCVVLGTLHSLHYNGYTLAGVIQHTDNRVVLDPVNKPKTYSIGRHTLSKKDIILYNSI